jgi:excisionase family DNA binding protein
MADMSLLTPDEIAERFRVSRRTVERAIARGDLVAERPFPRVTRVSEESLQQYLLTKSASPGGAGDPVPATSDPSTPSVPEKKAG